MIFATKQVIVVVAGMIEAPRPEAYLALTCLGECLLNLSGGSSSHPIDSIALRQRLFTFIFEVFFALESVHTPNGASRPAYPGLARGLSISDLLQRVALNEVEARGGDLVSARLSAICLALHELDLQLS